MSLAVDLMGLGMPPEQASRLGFSTFTTIAAAGTTQGTATLIPSLTNNVNATTASSQTGVILSNAYDLDMPYVIYNAGTLALNVYPPTSGLFNGSTANTAISVPVGAFVTVWRVSTTLWLATITGGALTGGGGSQAAQAVTATADGLTTGLISVGSTIVIITSAGANNIATLPGIATNSLPIGYTVRGRIAATGCEIRTPATTNETINGVDADASEAALAANAAFVAVVESATGWMMMNGTAPVPD